MTPLVEEWEEMNKHLSAPVEVISWSPAKRGHIGAHSVLCEMAGKGQEEMASALTLTLERARPSIVILTGIAGGFPALKVRRGDIVVAHMVYSFDYGKLVDGKFIRRPENDYNCDRSLLEFANLVARSESTDWQSRILQPRPDGQSGTSRAHTDCYIASSNKVVDDPNQEFYSAVADSFNEIHAVDTEAVGAGASVRLAQSERQLSLLVIRGISDEPGTPVANGTAHRTEWKRYAAAAAAAFTASLIERLPVRAANPRHFPKSAGPSQSPSATEGPGHTDNQATERALEEYCAAIVRNFSTIRSLGYESYASQRQPPGRFHERNLSTAFVPVLLSESGSQESFPMGPPKPIHEAVELNRRLLLRGVPGSGKTTLLRYLAHGFAESRLQTRYGRVPIYVRLQSFDPMARPLLDLVKSAIADNAKSEGTTQAIFADGRLLDQTLILFDGLDEIAGTVELAKLIDQLESLAESHPYTAIVVATRPLSGRVIRSPLRYSIFDLLPLDAESIESYVERWAEGREEVVVEVRRLLTSNARVASLASNPFLLSLICTCVELKAGRDLIRNRSDLYRTCTESLLGRLYDQERQQSSDGTMLQTIDVLKDVAYRFFLWQEPDFPAPYVNVIGARAAHGRLESSVEFLLDEVQRVCGLVHRSGDSYTFVHRTLWEYFAALAILDKDLSVTLQNANNPVWEEVIRLSAGLRGTTVEGALGMLRRLWSVNKPLALRASAETQQADLLIKELSSGDRSQAKNQKLLLLDALEQSLQLFSKPDQRHMVEETVTLLLLRFEERDAEVVYRAEDLLRRCGILALEPGGIIHTLLQLDRAEERRRGLLQDPAAHFSWIEVDGGEFWMGEDHHMFNERPARRVGVSSFRIAKHPVTNYMMANFNLVQPETIALGFPSHPVVGLTWYEARYFAIWLGCRLPQEREWEYAARGGLHSVRSAYFFGDDQEQLRNHAWFNEPDATRPHSVDEQNPFTQSENLNPLGIANILGNVWEWCDDAYSNPISSDGTRQGPEFHREEMMSGEKVMRGGAFRGSADTLRCARRVFANPRTRGSTVGFRLVGGVA